MSLLCDTCGKVMEDHSEKLKKRILIRKLKCNDFLECEGCGMPDTWKELKSDTNTILEHSICRLPWKIWDPNYKPPTQVIRTPTDIEPCKKYEPIIKKPATSPPILVKYKNEYIPESVFNKIQEIIAEDNKRKALGWVESDDIIDEENDIIVKKTTIGFIGSLCWKPKLM